MPEIGSATMFKDAVERDIVLLERVSGAMCQIYKHGATLTCWRPQQLVSKEGKDSNVFYVSKKEWTDKDEIWGGVPICFPQFAGNGKLDIHHGFARFSNEWVVDEFSLDEDWNPYAIMKLTDSDATRATGFEHAFEARLMVKLLENSLQMSMQVKNNNEAGEGNHMKLTYAFHNYFALPDISKAKLIGMDGVEYFDKVTGKEQTEDRKEVVINGQEIDNIYRRVPHPVELHIGNAANAKIIIEKKGCKDFVVWNIGKENIVKFDALARDDWQHYVCVEAAQAVKPVRIEPGESYTFEQNLTYSSE